MKKKSVSILLSAVMAASLLSGIGVSAESSEPVKLKALAILHPLTKDIPDMQWVQEMEEEANVEIEWEMIRADWETVKSTRFASGDIADILFNATVDSDYTKYSGLFLDLNDYLSEDLSRKETAFMKYYKGGPFAGGFLMILQVAKRIVNVRFTVEERGVIVWLRRKEQILA